MAHTLASSIGGAFKRVQFTPDLLPADLLGFSLYRMDRGEFEFIPGPVFANCVLADEINRASPRVQSALLESMNEGRVTLDGETRALPQPFLVIATRNDTDATGTFPLPEPQLDRFLVSIADGVAGCGIAKPDSISTCERRDSRRWRVMRHWSPGRKSSALQDEVETVPVSPAIAEYITALCQNLRRMAGSEHAVSIRASLAVLQAARARAFLEQAPAVHPDHVQAVFPAVMRHRVGSDEDGYAARWLASVLERTPVA